MVISIKFIAMHINVYQCAITYNIVKSCMCTLLFVKSLHPTTLNITEMHSNSKESSAQERLEEKTTSAFSVGTICIKTTRINGSMNPDI